MGASQGRRCGTTPGSYYPAMASKDKRRGHNEGGIYQRASDGLWVGSVNLGYGPDGKRKRKVFYGKKRPEVAEKMKVALRDQQQGTLIITKSQTTEQFLTHW